MTCFRNLGFCSKKSRKNHSFFDFLLLISFLLIDVFVGEYPSQREKSFSSFSFRNLTFSSF